MSDDEEEYEVFSISKSAGDEDPPSKRSTQKSHFGAVDEDVNLEYKRDVDDEAAGTSESSQGGYHAGAPPRTGPGSDTERQQEFQEGGETDGSSSSASQLAEVADRLIEEAGYRLCVYGIKNVKFVLAVGLGLFYAGIQTIFTSLVVPDIARDLCLEDSDTGWLRIIVLIGVSFGALLQGCISDLTCRRSCLLASLFIAGLFGIVASVLARSHPGLLFCLCMNGFGIGGILAIALPYYAELLPRQGFEKQIPSLMVFIVTGTAFISLIASEFSNVIPTLCSGYCFANWRITCVVLSVLPFLSALMVYLLQIPESPRLLMEHREWTKAIEALTHIYVNNHTGDDGETFKYKANELYRIGRQTRLKNASQTESTCLQSSVSAIASFFKNIAEVLRNPVGQFTDRLIICGCAFAFGYCGWALWLPDYIKAADIREHRSHASNISHMTISNVNYTDTIENTQYRNVTLINVQFLDMFLSDVHFHNAVFQNCRFQKIVSEGVKFSNCKINSTIFEKTDFRAEQFHDSIWQNSTFGQKSGACASEEPFAPTMAYYKIFLGHIGGILGIFLASFLMNFLGSRFMFIASCICTSILVFFVLVLTSSLSAMAVFLSLQFTGLTGWCALCVHCLLLYPTGKRGTALGLLVTLTTLGGLMGLGIVAELPIQTSEVAQTLVTSFLLLVGAVCMWTIPCVQDDLIR